MNLSEYLKVQPSFEVGFINNDEFLLDWCGIDYTHRSGVYVWNIGEEPVYIGQSGDIRNRVLRHCRQIINGRHYNQGFMNLVLDQWKSGNYTHVSVYDLPANVKMESSMIRRFKEADFWLLQNNHYAGMKK